MSQRRAKAARQLTHHVEYGGYIPAMMRSRAKLESMSLTPREMRRAVVMSERKMKKIMAINARWEENGCPE